MSLNAIIFDLDGTLIDSNRAHVAAWGTAMEKHGYQVSADRIAVEIGKGGDKLVPSILGKEIEDRCGDALRHAQVKEFTNIAESIHLVAFEGVESLFTLLRKRGIKIGLATSSKKDTVKTIQRSAGADWFRFFDVIATAEDAPEGKPAPDVLQIAIRKLKLSPTECVMVGDSPYDANTARDAGVVCLGFTCGKLNDAAALRAAGMRRVYRDPSDMAANLDDALRIASPGSIVLKQKMIESLMHEALKVAREGLDRGEVPIGCVIARGDGRIIARGHNEQNSSQNKIAHAEMVAFGRTVGKVPLGARDLILVSTLEPCVMCLGACMEAAVDTVIYGLSAPADGGRLRVRPPMSPENQMPRILGGVLAAQYRDLLRLFLKYPSSDPLQIDFVSELLSHAPSSLVVVQTPLLTG
jgi:HAD superfamily hydrolase (TIGR01509 family)